MDFFRTVAQRVAENLLFHVDGRLEKRSQRKNPNLEVNNCDVIKSPSVDLSFYNFPANFEQKVDQEESVDFLSECNVNGNCERMMNPNDSLRECNFKNDSVYVCCVCGDSFSSVHQFDEHELNNHPNVVCSYLDVDCVRDTPPHLLSWRHNSPIGVLRRCVVPPRLTNAADDKCTFKCTKCNQRFAVVGQLHQHIVDCALFTSQRKTEEKSSLTNNTDESCYKVRSCSRKRSTQVKFRRIAVDNQRCDVSVQVCIDSNSPSDNETVSPQVDSPQTCVVSSDAAPKRYLCTKCTKRFMFLVTLKKHQMSCSKVPFRGRKPKAFKSVVNRFMRGRRTLRRKPFKINHRKRKFTSSVVKNSERFNCAQLSKDVCSKFLIAKPLVSGDHRCPRCSRVFTYLANFKKHVKKNCIPKTLSATNNKSSDEVAAVTAQSDTSSDTHVSDEDLTDTEQKIECEEVPLLKDNSKLDLWRIKQEHPLYAFKGSPAQHHSCPYCQRGFTYLANYRKHINGICPIRQQKEKLKSDDSDVSVSDQSVCAILRDETKSNEMNNNDGEALKHTSNVETGDSKNSPETATFDVKENNVSGEESDGQKFRTFSCNICHRIYLSHVKMLRHMLSHKLAEGSSSTLCTSITDIAEEKCIAKQALQRHSTDSVRRIRANRARSCLQSEVPCANLLEDLARGGFKENRHSLFYEEDDTAPSSQTQMNGILAEDRVECDETLENNASYEIVITEPTESNESTSAEAEQPEICLPADTVLKLNPSINEQNEEVWITFAADDNENNDQSAYLQLSPSVTY